MSLEKTHPSGSEEWVCHECGRRILLTWPPDYEKIVLAVGDEFALHHGGKGGLQTTGPQVAEDLAPDFPSDLRSALEDTFKGMDFDDWNWDTGDLTDRV
jgi:hypothetical protein